MARKVYGLADEEGSEFGALNEEQKKLILMAVAEAGGGEGQAELEAASLAASEGLKETKDAVALANLEILALSLTIKSLNRDIATEGVINRRGEGQGITREKLRKAKDIDLSDVDTAKSFKEGTHG